MNIPSNETRPARHPGLVADAAGLLAAFLKYLKARAALFSIEAKEAGLNYGVAGGMAVGALLLVLLAYVFLIISAVFGIALLFDDEHAWAAVLAVTALLHGGGAVALVMFARRRIKEKPFHDTTNELTNDSEWLHQFANKS